MSNAFSALIWWVVPVMGLLGALGYVTWVTKFQGKFQQETQRSVGQFQRFQDSLRGSQARDVAANIELAANNEVEEFVIVDQNSAPDSQMLNDNSAPLTQNSSRISVIRPDAN